MKTAVYPGTFDPVTYGHLVHQSPVLLFPMAQRILFLPDALQLKGKPYIRYCLNFSQICLYVLRHLVCDFSGIPIGDRVVNNQYPAHWAFPLYTIRVLPILVSISTVEGS